MARSLPDTCPAAITFSQASRRALASVCRSRQASMSSASAGPATATRTADTKIARSICMWSQLLLPGEIKILAAGRRTIGEGLLLVPGRVPDVVADDVEQLSHFDMRLLDIARKRSCERAVDAFAVERGLAVLGGIHHHEA